MTVAVPSLLRHGLLFLCLLSHLDALVIRSGPSEVVGVTQATDFNLTCTYQQDYYPPACAEIAWYRNNVPIDPSNPGPNLRISRDGNNCTSVLGIVGARAEQSGWYTCAAADTSGRSEKDFFVVVNSAPVLIYNVNFTVNASLNASVPVPCPVSGVPFPNITWYQNVSSVGNGGFPVDNSFVDNVTGSLIISAIEMGVVSPSSVLFRCTARNDYGNLSAAIVAVSFDNSLPLDTAIKTSYESLPPVLECVTNTSALQNATFLWWHNGVPIPSSNRTYSPSGGGHYCCKVEASATETMYCTVIRQPNSIEFKVAPPVYTSIMAGRSVYLLCTIDVTNLPVYYDVPELRWQLGTTSTSTGTVPQKLFSYLYIGNAAPTQNMEYSCTNGPVTVKTNVTVVGACSSSNAIKSPGAEVQNETNMNWNFSESYVENVFGENCFVAPYNGTTARFSPPYIEQVLTQPARSTKACIRARLRHVGSNMVAPSVCLVAVKADDDSEKEVVCLRHPLPSSPAWYWMQTEISLLDEGIESTKVKLKIVLTVDNPMALDGVAYFDDITVSFSDPPIQLFIVFIVPFAAAVILTLCFAAAQICCRRKSGGVHSKKLMKKLSKFKFNTLQAEHGSGTTEPYLIRMVGDGKVKEKSHVGYMVQQTNFANQGTLTSCTECSQPEEYYYIEDPSDKGAKFIDPTGKGGPPIILVNTSTPKPDQKPEPVTSVEMTAAGDAKQTTSAEQDIGGHKLGTNSYLLVVEHAQCQATANTGGATTKDRKSKSVSSPLLTRTTSKSAEVSRTASTSFSGHTNNQSETTEVYESVDMPEPMANPNNPHTSVSGHMPVKGSKSLSTAEPPTIQVYEPVDMPEPMANPNNPHTSVSGRMPVKGSIAEITQDYEEVDFPTANPKQQVIAGSYEGLDANVPQQKQPHECNYMALTRDSTFNTYDSVNVTIKPPNDDDEDYY